MEEEESRGGCRSKQQRQGVAKAKSGRSVYGCRAVQHAMWSRLLVGPPCGVPLPPRAPCQTVPWQTHFVIAPVFIRLFSTKCQAAHTTILLSCIIELL